MESTSLSAGKYQNKSKRVSPRALNKEELELLQEPDVYRKQGEKVEDALYRDYIKRSAR